MDSTIKGILGESAKEADELDEKPEAAPAEGAPIRSTEDTETEELANLWNTGNKGDVVRRFMEMDNEKSVRLVFAIGMEGALELARMVDQAIEQGGTDQESSTEPARVERAETPEPGYPTREILGQEHEHD